MTAENLSNKWPIGIRLFNRPDYAEKLFQSLANQSLEIDSATVFCIIDGYQGSKAQKSGSPDNTGVVKNLVLKHFPHATVLKQENNIGLAKSLHILQTAVFEKTHADWALFFEDDLVLDPTYLEQINHLIEISHSSHEVVKVGAFQLRTGYIKNPPDSNRKDYFLGEGTKACAERRSYFELRTPLTETYLKALEGRQYSDRDHVKIYTEMAMQGVFSFVTYNDAMHDRMAAHFKKLHVVTSLPFADDIGSQGENNLRHPRVKLPHSSAAELLTYSENDFTQLIPALKLERDQLERVQFNNFYQQFMAVSRGRYALQFVITRGFEKIKAVTKNLFRK